LTNHNTITNTITHKALSMWQFNQLFKCLPLGKAVVSEGTIFQILYVATETGGRIS